MGFKVKKIKMTSPKVIDIIVNNDLCIGCGICVYSCPSKALEISWSESGFLIPKQVDDCKQEGECILICPFNPYPKDEVKTEDEIAKIYLKETQQTHPKIGNYNELYVGYSKEFRLNSSSGGIATYVFRELLGQGIVEYVLSVKESESNKYQYEYAFSSTEEELLAASKTKYYPVTFATIMNKIDAIEGKIAIVGVGCFIKAIRLAQKENKELNAKITFLVGIICGGIKSKFFTEYLAEISGVSYDKYMKPEFRIKDLENDASDYSFGCVDVDTLKSHKVKMKKVGDMWGTGMFKANACDFCDDVTTELADISVGDAWLNPYDKDGRGTNVIITRSTLASNIIKNGIKNGSLIIENVPLEKFLLSQKGSFNHRHLGLNTRIKTALKQNKIVPPKRVHLDKISFIFKITQKIRMKVRSQSIKVWSNTHNALIFDKKMKGILFILSKTTLVYHYTKTIKSYFNKRFTK